MPGYRAAQLLLDFTRGAERRHAALLRIRAQPGLFQPFGTTGVGRYPLLFRFLRDALGAETPVRLLSFGCATGEEVATLRGIFPDATIKGVDISPERIATCRRRLPPEQAERTTFAVADSARSEPDAAYDAVLALAVFRHAELDRASIVRNTLIPFDRFEREVTELARAVRPGGYLVIRHANFRFADTAAAAGFEAILAVPSDTPTFGRDGARLPGGRQETAIFRKR